MSDAKKQPTKQTIDTGGGSYVSGDASAGADFVGRDQITGESVVIQHYYGPAPTEPPEPMPLPDVPCPYRGLEFFDVQHAANYFGRADMTAKLLAKVQECNFIAVVGPSGSGKSSLVRAGLMVALQNGAIAGSRDWRLETFRPGEHPLLALAAKLVPLLDSTLSTVDRLSENEKLASKLRNGELSIGYVLDQLRGSLPKLLLIVDQFEESFTLCTDEPLRHIFLDTLLAAAEKPWLTVLFTLRADFYGRVLEREALSKRVDAGLVNVLPMTHAERRAAIEQPALLAGRHFESGLVERIVAAVEAEPGQLPLLEFALTELWARQSAAGTLTHAVYEAIGEVSGAIAKRADDTLRSLPKADQERVRTIFTRLVRVAPPDEGSDDTKRRLLLEELDPSLRPLVDKLADKDRRLLITGRDDQKGKETVEVAHEALIRGWGALQTWLNSDREFLLWRQRLRGLVDNWTAARKDEGSLLRGVTLAEADGYLAARASELSAGEHNFIRESQAWHECQIAEEESRRQRELARERALREEQEQRAVEREAATKQLRGRNRFLAVALAVAVLAAVVATVFFNRAQNTANDLELQKATVAVALITSDALSNERAVEVVARSIAEALAVTREAQANVARQTAEAETIRADENAARADMNAARSAERLSQLRGEELLKEARQLKIEGEVEAAIAKFEEADKVLPRPIFDLQIEKDDVLRQKAIQLVKAGEILARGGDLAGATKQYQAALDLNPPLDTPVYVHVPAGTFTMGADNQDSLANIDEEPQHKLILNEFWILRTEVTIREYQQCVATKVCEPPENYGRSNNSKLLTWPVVNITWDQANQYAHWKGGRLPTEAEWEKSCRGDQDTRIFPWGNDGPTSEKTNFMNNEGTWMPVGSYPNGVSPYGLHDMAGNVWEWTFDWYDSTYYSRSDPQNPQGSSHGTLHTLRGGSYNEVTNSMRCSNRDTGYFYSLDNMSVDVGFRYVSPGF